MQMNRTNRGQQMSQRELYDWIAMLGFCAVDMMLYLDTHPDDEDALNYFNQCTELYRNAKAAYEKQYGPLNAFSSTLSTRWEWNERMSVALSAQVPSSVLASSLSEGAALNSL